MATEEREGNLLTLMLNEAEDLDLSDPFLEGEERTSSDPKRLMIPGFEISRLFAIIEFAFLHAKDEDGILAGFNMMSRAEAVKAINGTFLFSVKNSDGKVQDFFVEMRKSGTFALVKPSKPKPDVTISVNDRDMVKLSTGQMSRASLLRIHARADTDATTPTAQVAFMRGKIKVKGNIMLGLRCQNLLQKEVAKMSRL